MSDENPTLGTLGPYLGVSKSSGALVGLTACNSQVKMMKTGPVSSGLVATYGKRVTLFTHKGTYEKYECVRTLYIISITTDVVVMAPHGL